MTRQTSARLLPLNLNEAARLYWELARRGAFCNGEKKPWAYKSLSDEELLVLAILQSRYDPRLMAVLVDYFHDPRLLEPVRFKKLLREHQALSLAAVIGDLILSRKVSDEVRDFFQFLRAGARPVPTQLYYRGLYPIGGRKMGQAVDRPLWAFKKWGFLAADPPVLKERKPAKGTYLFDLPSRLALLRELSRGRERFRLKDYLEKIDFSVSRQQALKDIKGAPWLRKRGQGKGTYYVASAS